MRNFLTRLDETRFLGLDVWEFSWRSLARRYGRWFLASVVLRHPCRTLRGLRRYRRAKCRPREEEPTVVGSPSVESMRDQLAEGGLVVATGFCQKPLDPPCPAGRFNHRCVVWSLNPRRELPPACRGCPIRELGLKTLAAGGALHIMTSAADIAADLFMPSLRHPRWRGAVLAICPYSIPPFGLAMSICGLHGILFSYDRGDCRDYRAWARADEGDKPEQTFLAPSVHLRLLRLLEEIAEIRSARKLPAYSGFREEKDFYLPVWDAPGIVPRAQAD